MAPPRPTAREVPMEVLNLGLCRTGTSSMREALLMLGYGNVYHMITVGKDAPWEPELWGEAFDAKFGGKGKPYGREQFDILLSRYNVVTDMPAAAFPEELMLAYPEAKLILTVRDSPEAWTRSMSDTIWKIMDLLIDLYHDPVIAVMKYITPMSRATMVPDKIHEYDIVGGLHKSPEFNRNVYLNHNAHVVQLAEKHGRQLLIFNVKEGWGPLCAFLGKDVPDGEFPRVNDTAEMQRMHQTVKIAAATIRTLFYGLSAAGVGWLAWVVSKRMRI